MLSICQAIARQEGFYVNGSRAARNNNPGNIVYGSFARSHNSTGSDGRFAIFPTPSDGFAAMASLMEAHYSGLTVAEAISKWAPPTENDTNRYIHDVCVWTGLQDTDLIDGHLLESAPTPPVAPETANV